MMWYAVSIRNKIRIFSWQGDFPREDVWTSACEFIMGSVGSKVLGPISAASPLEALLIAEKVISKN